jgi:uncharacterized protein (TIGR03437 family)
MGLHESWRGARPRCAPGRQRPRTRTRAEAWAGNARKVVWLAALCLGIFSAPPAVAQTVLLQGTATASYSASAGYYQGCAIQLTVQILNGPANISIPATWAGVVSDVQHMASWAGDGFPASGTVTISGCRQAAEVVSVCSGCVTTFALDSGSSWQLDLQLDGTWDFDLNWSGDDSNGNYWSDSYRYDGACSQNGPPQVTAAGVSGTYSGTACFGPGFYGGITSTVCLALPGATNPICPGSTPPAGPTISSLSPPSATAGGQAFPLTVNGANFGSDAVVQWNGAALPTHFVSSAQLTATVSASLIATAQTISISVTSGGQTSTSMPFTINPPSNGSTPAITSLVPNTVLVADDGSLACYPGNGAGGGICFNPSGSYSFGFAVDGTNFTSSGVVQWNGTATSTTFASVNELDATVPGSFLTSPGSVPITVSSGGETSAAVPFTITNFSFQRVSTQAPPADGSCVAPPPVTSFSTTDNTVYLYFFGVVTAGDTLKADWIGPDGTISTVGPWPSATGPHCFDSRSLSIGNLPASRLGSWQVRLSNNGNVLFTVPFSVSAAGATLGPSITAVSNAASYAAGGIAPGEIVYIAGSIAPGVNGFISPTGGFGPQAGGASIQFNGVAAPLIYVSATAAAAIVPYEVSGSMAQVTVTYQGQMSAPFQVPVISSIPGLFTANSSGTGEVAALNQDSSINSINNPAAPGSIVTLFATGEGQTSPAGVDGKLAVVPLPHPLLPVSVTMGSIGANVTYSGGAPAEVAGVMQVNVQLPAGVTGPAVPVLLIVGTATSQTGATIAVAGASSTAAK